jgi:hypothetical protein
LVAVLPGLSSVAPLPSPMPLPLPFFSPSPMRSPYPAMQLLIELWLAMLTPLHLQPLHQGLDGQALGRHLTEPGTRQDLTPSEPICESYKRGGLSSHTGESRDLGIHGHCPAESTHTSVPYGHPHPPTSHYSFEQPNAREEQVPAGA